jgi:hypothetical protein
LNHHGIDHQPNQNGNRNIYGSYITIAYDLNAISTHITDENTDSNAEDNPQREIFFKFAHKI